MAKGNLGLTFSTSEDGTTSVTTAGGKTKTYDADTGKWSSSSDTGEKESTTNLDNSVLGGSENSSSSYSGLSSEMNDYLTSWLPDSISSAMSGYSSALSNLANWDDYVEQYRTSMNKQYASDILQPTQDAINSAIRSAAGGGIVNSSITGDWISAAVADALASAESMQESSNQWAASANLEGLTAATDAYESYTALLGDYLGLTSTSESESTGSSWESILEYLDLGSGS